MIPIDPAGSATVNAPAPGVAGYEATIDYDPAVLEATAVEGEAFADPVAVVDDENGTVSISRTGDAAVDEPALASIEFAAVGDADAETSLSFVENETELFDADGETIPVAFSSGNVSVLPCASGDVNLDGSVDSLDATPTRRTIVGLPIEGAFDPSCADLDGDDEVSSIDGSLILQRVAGIDGGADAASGAAG